MNCRNNFDIMTSKERIDKAQYIALERLDYVTKCYETPDYVEVVGETGGDVITYRVYDDGSIYER